jgi:hypothetical protein
MSKFTPLIVLALVLSPAFLFAQTLQNRESGALRQLGLSDTQISQVLDLQTKMQTTVRDNMVHLRLIRAQIDEALLPDNPNMQKVNGLVDDQARIRAGMEKELLADRVKLRQIVGDQLYPQLLRMERRMAGDRGRRGYGPIDKGGPDGSAAPRQQGR